MIEVNQMLPRRCVPAAPRSSVPTRLCSHGGVRNKSKLGGINVREKQLILSRGYICHPFRHRVGWFVLEFVRLDKSLPHRGAPHAGSGSRTGKGPDKMDWADL